VAINLVSTPAHVGNVADEVMTLNEVLTDFYHFSGESGRAQQNGHRTDQFSSIHVALLLGRTRFELTVMSDGKVEKPDTPFCMGEKPYCLVTSRLAAFLHLPNILCFFVVKKNSQERGLCFLQR
jgi:hypothetical protein